MLFRESIQCYKVIFSKKKNPKQSLFCFCNCSLLIFHVLENFPTVTSFKISFKNRVYLRNIL